MPISDLFEKAANGDEVALIQMTWVIQNQQLLHDDMMHLITLSMNFEQSNIHQKYLIGLTNYFGATYFSPNIEKAEAIMLALVTEDDFSYAKNLLSRIRIALQLVILKSPPLNSSDTITLNFLLIKLIYYIRMWYPNKASI